MSNLVGDPHSKGRDSLLLFYSIHGIIKFMQTDFSFNNAAIRKYFEGDDSIAPTRELVYLHSHPLIQPNFVTEVENLIAESIKRLTIQRVSKNSKWVTELESLCIKLGQTMPEVQITNPEETLIHLRDLYILCNKILKA